MPKKYSMTRRLRDGSEMEYNVRSPFWKQLRECPFLKSEDGIVITDMDAQMFSWQSGSFLCFEHKCRGVMPSNAQTQACQVNDELYTRGAPSGSYRGYYLIKHAGEDAFDRETLVYKMIDGNWCPITGSLGGYPIFYYKAEVFQFLRQRLL